MIAENVERVERRRKKTRRKPFPFNIIVIVSIMFIFEPAFLSIFCCVLLIAFY